MDKNTIKDQLCAFKLFVILLLQYVKTLKGNQREKHRRLYIDNVTIQPCNSLTFLKVEIKNNAPQSCSSQYIKRYR